ncbi:MAG: hypothetical protein UU51_C0004G0018 [Microgenomates group bacterium GW2011_GWC1_41_20]|uniref:Uncharacterized protein n=7 Tax=Candidatus Woeseibacteriota TaxID=1752722 RepID=A0A0G0U860_9BACT|nr:MAG: hypothetical protein UT76_C0003G0012 [Candidatus Woesebacteria bacterium GW2011_GWB1_40_12]KKR55645.1 MAG: hypothetical protein UT93_C0020G0003 [Candidatus Woesebacteria bacterium GW2011_GWF1_40_24]KKR90829.1 MAG: hypothetical protein UU39_C0007G0005 [Candidatus Woesebacteria bacterium GW2011_GWD1_41_12]KKS00623.1 MAG: hypothetical protein UU51_C0004G0018 [Microgenomates group bacterium GW2011_GWC1_41_20]KKS05452.1 MAG: hypothetical protein UU57_C0006G0003 [Candidatus Woesebacteria bact
MSKLFFDNIIMFEEVDKAIKNVASSTEELNELRDIVDGIVNHKVVEKVLDKLPKEHHEGFLALFHKCPHDEVTIFEYINQKSGRDIREELENDLKSISSDILHELSPKDEVSEETGVSKK